MTNPEYGTGLLEILAPYEAILDKFRNDHPEEYAALIRELRHELWEEDHHVA
jgi:hypothetical protein